jgi:hypothetical protein
MFRYRFICVALGIVAAVAVGSAQTPKGAPPAKPQAPAAAKSKLPAAVEAAFKKAYPNATIKNASSEKEDGRIEWEIESVDGKTNRDLVYLADGTLVVAEEQIEASAVPAPVMTAFKARYPKAKVSKYEKLTKGTATSYEMQFSGESVKEAELAPDGTFINPKPVKK